MERRSSQGASPFLHNTGGPRSRVRSEEIRSDLLGERNSETHGGIVGVHLHHKTVAIETWLLRIGRQLGWQSMEEMMDAVGLLEEECLVLPASPDQALRRITNEETIRNALILAMAGLARYRPGSPLIFSRSRLERKIRLVKINLESYYEMD